MSRISIDVTPEEHQKLKAMAALTGKSIKDYVIERTLGAEGDSREAAALKEPLGQIATRLRQANRLTREKLLDDSISRKQTLFHPRR